MSFKREGDDFALLNNLKRRRVSELLVCHIPEDEALLLKNGKYACSICHHKPIFDTIDMLSLHRKGNKHLTNLTYHLEKQNKFEEQQMRKTGNLNLQKVEAKKRKAQQRKTHRLLKSGPYRRKLKIDIEPLSPAVSSTTAQGEFPQPKACSASSLVRSYIKNLPKKKNFVKTVEMARLNSLGPSTQTSQFAEKVTKLKKQQNNDVVYGPKNQEIGEEEQRRAEYYLNLRASGWKKDHNGEWAKEDGVEFDSDEETPSEYPS